MKYIVVVSEFSKGYIEVDANTPAEAELLAEEEYFACHTIWDDEDVSFVVL